jgi:hypothetical protein
MMDNENEWSKDGPDIASPDRLASIRHVLENVGPIIVEHWFYYGSCSPERRLFEEYDEFVAYMKTSSRPGDSFHVWNFAQTCTDDNMLVNGKYPDADGRVPRRGAY